MQCKRKFHCSEPVTHIHGLPYAGLAEDMSRVLRQADCDPPLFRGLWAMLSAASRRLNRRRPYHGLDGPCSNHHVVVLPETQDDPSRFAKSSIRVPVAVHVRRQFGSPPRAVAARKCAVYRACMPEASIYEYGYPATREKNIGPSPRDLRELGVHPITETTPMQFFPQAELRASVTSALPGHPARDALFHRLPGPLHAPRSEHGAPPFGLFAHRGLRHLVFVLCSWTLPFHGVSGFS